MNVSKFCYTTFVAQVLRAIESPSSVGGLNSAREQNSSIGGGAGSVCLGVVHMEEEVQDRVLLPTKKIT